MQLTQNLTDKENQFNKLIKQVDDLEGVSDMKEEVEKKKETWQLIGCGSDYDTILQSCR